MWDEGREGIADRHFPTSLVELVALREVSWSDDSWLSFTEKFQSQFNPLPPKSAIWHRKS